MFGFDKSTLEKIYITMPTWMQQLACNVEGLRQKNKQMGKDFYRLLNELDARTYWSPEQIQRFRNQRLQAFIQHSATTVPYYRRLFHDLKINPADIKTLTDLSPLPILTKAAVQENYQAMVSEAVPLRDRLPAHTSGTTGGGLYFFTTKQAVHEQWATWWRYRRWHGIQPTVWSAHFGRRYLMVPPSQTSPPFWRYNYPQRQILFSAYHLTPDYLGAYVEELRRRRPPWIHGYPSLIALLASYVIENQIDLGYQVTWVTIGAENLLPQQVTLIERAFGVRPRQHYGMEEAVANISECEYGNLHVDEDFAAVEFIPTGDGSHFRIIGTNFTNLATPLLRYDVQDLVTLDNQTPCPCGRPGRRISSLDGRQDDYIILKDGRKMGGVEHFFKNLTSVREAQILQKEPGDIAIRIVRGKSFSHQDELDLAYEVKKRFGDNIDFSIEYVDKLLRSPTGKIRFIISEIPTGRIDSATSAH